MSFSPSAYLDNIDVSYLDRMLLNENGILGVRDAELYKHIPINHLALFCHKYGIYCLPTTELINWIESLHYYDKTKTIEIGSGVGTLGRALGIKMTDSKLQENDKIKLAYEAMGQPTIKYPSDIIKRTATRAIARYKPDIVIGSWITHKFEESSAPRHKGGGNWWGVNEQLILDRVKYYILIGNKQTHQYKPIMSLPHEEYKYDWLYSRSMYPTDNFIAIWEGIKKYD